MTVSGNNASRVFNVNNGNFGTVRTVRIEGLTVTAGQFAGSGGGVHNAGALTLAGVTLSRNLHAVSGGGVYNTGTLTLSGSTVSGNTANYLWSLSGEDGGGGGVFNSYGTVTVPDQRCPATPRTKKAAGFTTPASSR